jgi:DNA-binding response OmpR family regulator
MGILVVEDEEGIATALQRGLTADGFAVDVASNGIDGL